MFSVVLRRPACTLVTNTFCVKPIAATSAVNQQRYITTSSTLRQDANDSTTTKKKKKSKKPSSNNDKNKSDKKEAEDTPQLLKRLAEEHGVDFTSLINEHGLGQTDGSAEWRDKQLESRVAGLFKQTMDMMRSPGTPLHPLDIKTREEGEVAQARIVLKLQELKISEPDRFNKVYSYIMTLITNEEKKSKEEVAAMSEGAVPGSITPPWVAGGGVWKSFFDDLNTSAGAVNADLQGPFQSDQEEAEPTDHPLAENFPFVPQLGSSTKLEQLDDPYVWIDDKTKKRKCIFCSPTRHLYPLEPMNVPLLIRFVNPGGFIKPRNETGLCKTMQARVARTIKQARTIGVFSYKGKTFTVRNPAPPFMPPKAETEDDEFGEGDVEDYDVPTTSQGGDMDEDKKSDNDDDDGWDEKYF